MNIEQRLAILEKKVGIKENQNYFLNLPKTGRFMKSIPQYRKLLELGYKSAFEYNKNPKYTEGFPTVYPFLLAEVKLYKDEEDRYDPTYRYFYLIENKNEEIVIFTRTRKTLKSESTKKILYKEDKSEFTDSTWIDIWSSILDYVKVVDSKWFYYQD